MNYVCISINKEVVNKEVFSDKQQAADYFQILHGETIREEKEKLKIRLGNSIRNYECRIHKELAADAKRKLEGKVNLEVLGEKKANKEAELEQLNLDMDKIEVVYEAKYNGYKENLFTQEPQLILHISGIYRNGNLFTVIEEKYYYIGAKIKSDAPIYSVVKKLPPQFDINRISLYLFKEKEKLEEFDIVGCPITLLNNQDLERLVESDNTDKVQKTVTNIRNQILRNFQNGSSRVRAV